MTCECRIQVYAVKEFKNSDHLYQRLVGLTLVQTDAKVYTNHMNTQFANDDVFYDYREWTVN